MKEDSKSTETTSRRQFTKALVTAAVAAPIAASLASCRKETPQNTSSGQATPQPSPTPDDKLDGEGTPITVGGGGGSLKDRTEEDNVSCQFKENADHLEEDPNNPPRGKKKFKNKKGWKIQTFKIESDGVWTDYSDLLPENGNCTVLIRCAGGDDNEVKIFGGSFGLEMDTERYQRISAGHYRNPNAGHHIKQVILSTPTGFPLNKLFNEADKCKVCTDHRTPRKSCGSPTPTPSP